MNSQPVKKMKKLELHKETIRVLDESELAKVAGGTLPTGEETIFTSFNCPSAGCPCIGNNGLLPTSPISA